jgi:hypothetical protein
MDKKHNTHFLHFTNLQILINKLLEWRGRHDSEYFEISIIKEILNIEAA